MKQIDSSLLKQIFARIVGARLESLSCACRMMMFTFGDCAIHVQSLARIINDGEILVTTRDYRSWDTGDENNNDEFFNIEKFKNQIVGGKILSVDIGVANDLKISLDNGILIEIFNENGYAHFADEQEQYRIFSVPGGDHIVVYNKHIEAV